MGEPAELTIEERAQTYIDAHHIVDAVRRDEVHPFAGLSGTLGDADLDALEMLILRLAQEVIRLSDSP